MSDDNAISIPQGHDALQQLKDSLTQQFGQLPSGPVSDMINQKLNEIDDALTALNQADEATSTVAINAAAAGLDSPIKNLGTLKKQIQSITNDVDVASQILGNVGQFISGVKSFFGVL